LETIFLIIGGVITLGLLIGITEFAVGRFSGWHKLLALAAAIGGGIIGFLDDRIPGAIGGSALGGLAGFLLGSVLFGVINAVWLSGTVRGEAEPSRKVVTLPERIILSIFRLVAVAIVAVVIHEMIWLINATAIVGNFGAGVAIANEAASEETESSLADMAKDVRWRVSVFRARPLRWCTITEVANSNAQVLELLDDLIGESPNANPIWQDDADGVRLNAKSDGEELVDNTLLQAGTSICKQSLQQIDGCLQRGLLTRFVSTDWIFEILELSPKLVRESNSDETTD